MAKRMTRRAIALVGALALAAAVGFHFAGASAQQPRGGPGWSGPWDMWEPGWMARDMWGPERMGPGMRQRMARHWTFMHQGIPDSYIGSRNPFPSDPETIAAGRALYQQNCSSCHGTTGLGDGEAAKALNPSPALLAYMIQMPMSVDEYMLWTISDGGGAFGTAMPAFKDVLSTDDIWKIVVYMRAGFPPGPTEE